MVCSRPIVYLFRAPYSTCSNGSSHVGSIRVHVELVNGCPILTPVCQHMELVIEIVFANRRCACQGLFALEAGHVDTVRNNGTDTKRVCRVVRPQHETVCGISSSSLPAYPLVCTFLSDDMPKQMLSQAFSGFPLSRKSSLLHEKSSVHSNIVAMPPAIQLGFFLCTFISSVLYLFA